LPFRDHPASGSRLGLILEQLAVIHLHERPGNPDRATVKIDVTTVKCRQLTEAYPDSPAPRDLR